MNCNAVNHVDIYCGSEEGWTFMLYASMNRICSEC
jgi:hypothetical protein